MTAPERAKLKMSPNAWATYRRLLSYLRPHRGMFALGIVGAMLFSTSMVMFSWFAKEFGDGTDGRYHRFTFIADNDEKFTYSFHLDDPAVNFFTHREILKLAMRSV